MDAGSLDGSIQHYHQYTGEMHSQQGANIQGSQTIHNANFNYITPPPPQRESSLNSFLPLYTDAKLREIARSFVFDTYYPTFCRDPAGLAYLYGENSTLTFDGEKYLGSGNIIAKLTSLPYHQVKYNISYYDHQLDSHSGGIIISVFGELVVGGRLPAQKFSQVFHLMPTSQGSLYIANDIFRFIHT